MPIPKWLEEWQERELARIDGLSDAEIRAELIAEYGSVELYEKAAGMTQAMIQRLLAKYRPQ